MRNIINIELITEDKVPSFDVTTVWLEVFSGISRFLQISQSFVSVRTRSSTFNNPLHHCQYLFCFHTNPVEVLYCAIQYSSTIFYALWPQRSFFEYTFEFDSFCTLISLSFLIVLYHGQIIVHICFNILHQFFINSSSGNLTITIYPFRNSCLSLLKRYMFLVQLNVIHHKQQVVESYTAIRQLIWCYDNGINTMWSSSKSLHLNSTLNTSMLDVSTVFHFPMLSNSS